MGIRPCVAYFCRDHIAYDEEFPFQHGLVGADFSLGSLHHLHVYLGQRASLTILLGSWNSESSRAFGSTLHLRSAAKITTDLLRCSRLAMAFGQLPHFPRYRSRRSLRCTMLERSGTGKGSNRQREGVKLQLIEAGFQKKYHKAKKNSHSYLTHILHNEERFCMKGGFRHRSE